MKTIKRVVLILAIIVISVTQLLAVEGLQIAVQNTNAVLSWPSDTSATYIIQYRHTWDATDSWNTLQDFYPPDYSSNITYFVDFSNVVHFGTSVGGGGTNGGVPMPPLPNGGGYGFNITNTAGVPGLGFYRVVRDGVHLFGLTNDTVLSGVVQIFVEAGYGEGTLSSVILNANGNPIPGTQMFSQPFSPLIDDAGSITQSPVGSLNFTVDTRRLANGDYYLQANGKWAWSPTNDYGVPFVALSSPSVLVHITNEIAFPDRVQEFRDDLMQINVTSAITNVDWKVDIYGQTNDYIISFTNHSDDGTISFSWNLLDTNGNPRTDLSFKTITTISDPATETNPPLIRVVDNYPSQGMWVVARADYIPSNAENYSAYVSVENSWATIGEAAGGVLPGSPYRSSGQAQFINTLTNVGAFFKAITNQSVRNFYFDGHGGPDWIGFFPGFDGEKNRTISSALLQMFLHTDTPSTNSIRYRFVWIDSCNSALGDWPKTFGIGSRENVVLTNFVSRPAAFCGFTTETYGYTALEHGNVIDIGKIDWRSYVQLFWADYEEGIRDAVDNASFYSEEYDDANYLKIYGYWGLGFNDLNYKTDWPPSP